MTVPAVTVLIVTYNSATTIDECLQCVERAIAGLPSPVEVIVWDNASTDATLAIVRRHPLAANDDFRLVASRENLGFGGGNNAAAVHATAPLLLLLNPDAFLDDPSSIARLRDAMLGEGAAIAGPFLTNADGSHQVGDAGHAETLGVAALWAFGLNLIRGVRGSFLSRSYPIESPPLPIDWVCGACLLIERQLFETLKGFDERIFLYSEDVDLCLRARRLGAHVLYVPGVRVRHIQGVSLGDGISTRWLDSRFALFEREHRSRVQRFSFALILAVGMSWRWAAYSVAEKLSVGRRERNMTARMRAYLEFSVRRARQSIRRSSDVAGAER